MTDSTLNPPQEPVPPPGRSVWWKALLIGSLALNLLFVGGGVARVFVHEPPERMAGISEMQLIPRKFFGDVSRERRHELAAVFKTYRVDFRDGREARRKLAADLAAALAATPYDEARVKAAVAAFNERSSSLVIRGGDAALEFIAKLTPEERQLLSNRIGERVKGGKKDKDRDKDGD